MISKSIKITVFIVILLVSSLSHAEIVGSWYSKTDSESPLYAGTANDSGAILGQFCFPNEGSCLWLIGMKTECQKGNKYPALANSDAGAVPLELYCDGQSDNGLYRYAFSNFDAIDNAIRKGTRIGIALPLQTDQFIVVRFLLDGAVEAIDYMRAESEKRVNPQKQKTTHDQYL